MGLHLYAHWSARCRNGSSSVILGGEDVATRPGNLSTESFESFDQHGGLNGCSQSGQPLVPYPRPRWGNQLMCKQPAIRAPFKGCSWAYLCLVAIKPGISISASSISLMEAVSGQIYGRGDQQIAPSAKGRQAYVGDLEFLCWSRHDDWYRPEFEFARTTLLKTSSEYLLKCMRRAVKEATLQCVSEKSDVSHRLSFGRTGLLAPIIT